MPQLGQQAADPGRMRPDFQRDATARHGSEYFLQRFRIRAQLAVPATVWPASSNTQYQLFDLPGRVRRSISAVKYFCLAALLRC